MVVCTLPWTSPESASNACSAPDAGEIDDRLHQRAKQRASIQGARRRCAGSGVCATDAEGDVVAVERQKHVVRVVAERRSEEGQVAGDIRERAGDAAVRSQDRVSRLARIVAVLRQHLHSAAGERARAAGEDFIRLPSRIGLDLVDRARAEAHIARDIERADGVARRGCTAAHHIEAADAAVAHQRAARIDEHRRGQRAVHTEDAGVDVGRSRIGACARQHERPGADLGQAAGSGDRAGEDGAGVVVAGGEYGARRA